MLKFNIRANEPELDEQSAFASMESHFGQDPSPFFNEGDNEDED